MAADDGVVGGSPGHHTFLWGIRPLSVRLCTRFSGGSDPKCETLQPQPLVWGRGREGHTFTSVYPAPLAHGPHSDGFRGPARTGPEFPDPVGSWGQRDPQSTGEGVRKTTPGSAVSVVGPLGPSGGLQRWRHGGAGRALGTQEAAWG